MQKTARWFCAIRQFYKKSVKTAAKICIKLLNGKTRSVNIILIPLIFIVLNGSSSSGSSSTTAPTVDGKETTWTDIASDIAKLTDGKNATIELNGATSVPADVIKAIASSNAEVTLKVGDVFMLHVLNEILTYEIDQILIVEPQDTDPLLIEPGKDLCTMITCTPYGINSHRMLVRGHRIESQEEAKVIRITADAVRIEPLMVAPFVAVPILLVLLIILLLPKQKKGKL